jgi:hypothetical protein
MTSARRGWPSRSLGCRRLRRQPRRLKVVGRSVKVLGTTHRFGPHEEVAYRLRLDTWASDDSECQSAQREVRKDRLRSRGARDRRWGSRRLHNGHRSRRHGFRRRRCGVCRLCWNRERWRGPASGRCERGGCGRRRHERWWRGWCGRRRHERWWRGCRRRECWARRCGRQCGDGRNLGRRNVHRRRFVHARLRRGHVLRITGNVQCDLPEKLHHDLSRLC